MIMDNEVNEAKVEENENKGLEIIDLPPVEVEKADDETPESTLSTKEMIAGGAALALAAIGTAWVGSKICQGVKFVVGKIKDKKEKEDKITPPPTAEINEQQDVVIEATDVEVKDDEDKE